MTNGDVLMHYYRIEDRLFGDGYTNVCGEHVHTGSHVELSVYKLPLLKRTPCGVVVRDIGGSRRFIADSWRKRYACATYEEAVVSFVARKERQASIYEARASDARKAIKMATTGEPRWSVLEAFGGFIR